MVSLRAATILGLFGAVTLPLSAGCNFSTFDDLGDETWAMSIGAPSQVPSDNFGTGVGFVNNTTDAARLMVVGGNPDGIAILSIDAAGGLSSDGEPFQGNVLNPGADAVAVPAPMANDFLSTDGAVAIGASEPAGAGTAGRLLIYNGDGAAEGHTLGTVAIHAVAFGAVNNPDNADAVDLVATTGDQLHVRGNYADNAKTLETCGLARDRAYAVAVADLHSGMPESEILVAMGNSNQDGTGSVVMLIDAATIALADADQQDQSCIAGTRTSLHEFQAPNSEPDFGNSVVVGDFDGGNGLDIAIGAPSSNLVYVYMNVDLAAGVPTATPIEIGGPTGSVRFGATLAVGDFNNDGADELVVGDPQAAPDGVRNAGRAYLIPADGDFSTKHILGDADPQADQNFGRALSVSSFAGGTGSILAVGAHKEVFVYFRTHISDDVRN